jgi:biopolymer transport protein ExbD
MKFPRNVRILKGSPDYAAFACVLFLLIIFIMIGPLVYTSGLRVQLPLSTEMPGPERPSVQLAVDADGRLYFQNEEVTEGELGRRLQAEVKQAGEPLTLVIQADKSFTSDQLIRLGTIARQAGIYDALLATLPRLVEPPRPPPNP